MNQYSGTHPGKYPAIVREYLQASRQCRVEIPGVTDGAEVLPLAEIEYPIGDKSSHGSYPTEIEILPGDMVFIEFLGADPRYPIITGYRNPQIGNSTDWRRTHHKNTEQLSEDTHRIAVGGSEIILTRNDITIKTGGSTIVLNASSIAQTSSAIGLTGALTNTSGSKANFSGGMESSVDNISKGIVLATHTHSGAQSGGSSTGQPK